MALSWIICCLVSNSINANFMVLPMAINRKKGIAMDRNNCPKNYQMGNYWYTESGRWSQESRPRIIINKPYANNRILGLFAFLIVTYLPLDTQSVMIVSGAVYIILVAFISVIRAGTLSTMVFADTGNRRLLPMGTFVEDMLGPWVGVGLLFLISRQIFYGTELRSGEMFGDPVIFSLAILLVLYTATMIGVAVEISFFRSRAESVRVKFQNQMIDEFEPQLYLFTRNLGMLKISRLMTLRQWVEQGEKINLNDLDKLKRS